jgi:hypothetical protein
VTEAEKAAAAAKRDAVLAVACLGCGAGPGERCVNSITQEPHNIVHAVRVTAWEEASVEEKKDWYFTFGHGHYLFAGHQGGTDIQVGVFVGGLPLSNYYVVINGTFNGARLRIQEIFGGLWCDQYDSLEAFAPYYPEPPVRLPVTIPEDDPAGNSPAGAVRRGKCD